MEGATTFIRLAASSPFMSGRLMSKRITSGCSSAALLIAADPFRFTDNLKLDMRPQQGAPSLSDRRTVIYEKSANRLEAHRSSAPGRFHEAEGVKAIYSTSFTTDVRHHTQAGLRTEFLRERIIEHSIQKEDNKGRRHLRAILDFNKPWAVLIPMLTGC